MSNPTVCCIMLTRDRPEMSKRAVSAFHAQTYGDKCLVIWDTSDPAWHPEDEDEKQVAHISERMFGGGRPRSFSIGKLRNKANAIACTSDVVQIIAHWDSDDWSHPNRLTEQVDLLRSSDYDVVGYHDMLFWRYRQLTEKDVYGEGTEEPWDVAEEAYLYTHGTTALGTSLLYHRRTWELKPFADIPTPDSPVGEDFVFQSGLRVKTVSSFGPCGRHDPAKDHEPRMIASLHGGNSNAAYYDVAIRQGDAFRRAPEWDAICAERMRL